MNFIKRFGFYGGGFAIGIVFLIFFLTGKRTQCTWLPEDRVLNDISRKNYVRFSPEVRDLLQQSKIDTLDIQLILKYGRVDFSKSNTDTIPCNFYHISGRKELATTSLWVRNCDRFTRVEKVLTQ